MYSRHLLKAVAVSLLLSVLVPSLLARPSGTASPGLPESTQSGTSPAQPADKSAKDKDKDQRGPIDLTAQKAAREEIQGVFVISGDHAEFHKVETGIAGATDIEVLTGLDNGDQIVIGSYKTIRSMRDKARVKIDNRAPVVNDSKS